MKRPTTGRNATAVVALLCSVAVPSCGRKEQKSDVRTTRDQDARVAPSDTVLPTQELKVDAKVNGEDGPVFVKAGTEADLSWTSEGASFCLGPGIHELSGAIKLVVQKDAELVVSCMNGDGPKTDSVAIVIGEKPSPSP